MAATPLTEKTRKHGTYSITAYQDVFAIPSVMEYHQRKFASTYGTFASECAVLDSEAHSELESGAWQQFSQLALDMTTMARAPAPPRPEPVPTDSATLLQLAATATTNQQQQHQRPEASISTSTSTNTNTNTNSSLRTEKEHIEHSLNEPMALYAEDTAVLTRLP
jgi:hypothetical protein